MSYDLSIWTAPGGRRLYSCTPTAQQVEHSTNERGFADLAAFVGMPFHEAVRFYRQFGVCYVVLDYLGSVVWEGRLEDPELTCQPAGDGMRLRAFGYQNAYRDLESYTALWSSQDVSQWQPVTTKQESSRTPDRYSFEVNNGIRIAPRKGANVDSSSVGSITYETPDDSETSIVYVSFTYEANLPSATWRARLTSWNRDFTGVTVEWSLDGTQASTAVTVGPFTGKARLMLELFYNTGVTATYGGESGQYYALWTNLRWASVSGNPPLASEIASALVTYVAGVNAAQISTSTGAIISPGDYLKEEVYEDQTPAAILDRLAARGDAAGRRWEWCVWEDRVLRFQPQVTVDDPTSYNHRVWYVDAGSLRANRSLSGLTNSTYALYQDVDSATIRTAIAADTASITRYGVTRRRAVSADTTDATLAGYVRDLALVDGKRIVPEAAITIEGPVYTGRGAPMPTHLVRAGHVLIVRNTPSQLTAEPGIAAFRIIETRWRDGVLTVTPENYTPRLDTMLARREARL